MAAENSEKPTNEEALPVPVKVRIGLAPTAARSITPLKKLLVREDGEEIGKLGFINPTSGPSEPPPPDAVLETQRMLEKQDREKASQLATYTRTKPPEGEVALSPDKKRKAGYEKTAKEEFRKESENIWNKLSAKNMHPTELSEEAQRSLRARDIVEKAEFNSEVIKQKLNDKELPEKGKQDVDAALELIRSKIENKVAEDELQKHQVGRVQARIKARREEPKEDIENFKSNPTLEVTPSGKYEVTRKLFLDQLNDASVPDADGKLPFTQELLKKTSDAVHKAFEKSDRSEIYLALKEAAEKDPDLHNTIGDNLDGFAESFDMIDGKAPRATVENVHSITGAIIPEREKQEPVKIEDSPLALKQIEEKVEVKIEEDPLANVPVNPITGAIKPDAQPPQPKEEVKLENLTRDERIANAKKQLMELTVLKQQALKEQRAFLPEQQHEIDVRMIADSPLYNNYDLNTMKAELHRRTVQKISREKPNPLADKYIENLRDAIEFVTREIGEKPLEEIKKDEPKTEQEIEAFKPIVGQQQPVQKVEAQSPVEAQPAQEKTQLTPEQEFAEGTKKLLAKRETYQPGTPEYKNIEAEIAIRENAANFTASALRQKAEKLEQEFPDVKDPLAEQFRKAAELREQVFGKDEPITPLSEQAKPAELRHKTEQLALTSNQKSEKLQIRIGEIDEEKEKLRAEGKTATLEFANLLVEEQLLMKAIRFSGDVSKLRQIAAELQEKHKLNPNERTARAIEEFNKAANFAEKVLGEAETSEQIPVAQENLPQQQKVPLGNARQRHYPAHDMKKPQESVPVESTLPETTTEWLDRPDKERAEQDRKIAEERQARDDEAMRVFNQQEQQRREQSENRGKLEFAVTHEQRKELRNAIQETIAQGRTHDETLRNARGENINVIQEQKNAFPTQVAFTEFGIDWQAAKSKEQYNGLAQRFENLTNEQQQLVFKNLQRISYVDIAKKASSLLTNETAQLHTITRVGRQLKEGAIGKGGKIAAFEKEILDKIRNGGLETHGKTLDVLIDLAEGVEVVRNQETGAVEANFVNSKDFRPEFKDRVDKFNEYARLYADAPTDTPEERQKFRELELYYNLAKEDLFVAARKQWEDPQKAFEYMYYREYLVQMRRFLEKNPDVEEAVDARDTINDKGYWKELAKSTGGKMFEKVGLMATGGALRALTVGTLGMASWPAAATVSGLIKGARSAWTARETADEQREAGQEGLTRPEMAKLAHSQGLIKKALDQKGTHVVGKAFKKTKFEDADNLNKRIENLIVKIQSSETKNPYLAANQLDRLVNHCEEAIANKLINFGNKTDRLFAQYEFSTHLAAAKMEIWRSRNEKNVQASKDYLQLKKLRMANSEKLMELKNSRAESNRTKFIWKKFGQGLAIGATFGSVGATFGGWIREQFGGNVVEAPKLSNELVSEGKHATQKFNNHLRAVREHPSATNDEKLQQAKKEVDEVYRRVHKEVGAVHLDKVIPKPTPELPPSNILTTPQSEKTGEVFTELKIEKGSVWKNVYNELKERNIEGFQDMDPKERAHFVDTIVKREHMQGMHKIQKGDVMYFKTSDRWHDFAEDTRAKSAAGKLEGITKVVKEPETAPRVESTPTTENVPPPKSATPPIENTSAPTKVSSAVSSALPEEKVTSRPIFSERGRHISTRGALRLIPTAEHNYLGNKYAGIDFREYVELRKLKLPEVVKKVEDDPNSYSEGILRLVNQDVRRNVRIPENAKKTLFELINDIRNKR